MKQVAIVDATIIAAPSWTKNKAGERDPEMHQINKGNQWYFGMKVDLGVESENGLIHYVETTAAMCMTPPRPVCYCIVRRPWFMAMPDTRELISDPRCKAEVSASELP